MNANGASRYRVWDLPSRLSHGAIVTLVFAQFASGLFELLPMSTHLWCGYALLVVVLFRILWGFFGSESARFSRFLRGPIEVLRYARTLPSTMPSHTPGHNPLGGWSVVLLLGFTLVQAGSGLFAGKPGDLMGPLANRFGRDLSHALNDLHEAFVWLLLMLVVTHIGAGLFYLLHKRENLITPMFGDGRLPLPTDPEIRFASGARAWTVLAISVTTVGAVVALGNR